MLVVPMNPEFTKIEAGMRFEVKEKTFMITIGDHRDNIPAPAYASIRLDHERLEKSIWFSAAITKKVIRKEDGYTVKLIRIPARLEKNIPRDLKKINCNLKITS